jgi:hypothetical protein
MKRCAIFYRETRKAKLQQNMVQGTIFYREMSWYGILPHCEISWNNIAPRFVHRQNIASRPKLRGPVFYNYVITWILLGTHARCNCFFNGGSESNNTRKMEIYFFIYVWQKQKPVGFPSQFSLDHFGSPWASNFKNPLAPYRCRFDTHSRRRTIHARKPVQGPNADSLSAGARNI